MLKGNRITSPAVSLLLVVLLPWTVGSATSGVCVIANPSVTASAISSRDLRDVFLLTRTSLADGSLAEPVLMEKGAAHELFVRQYVGKTDSALSIYYRRLVFTGKRLMPKSFTSEAAMVSYVAKTKGAVGYVNCTACLSGVKVLDVEP